MAKQKKRSTFSRPVRDSDVVPTAKLRATSGVRAYGQNLADKKGTAASGRLLYSTH